jgi:hypothetical protein
MERHKAVSEREAKFIFFTPGFRLEREIQWQGRNGLNG